MGNKLTTYIENIRAGLKDYKTLLQFEDKDHAEFVKAAKLAELAYKDGDQLRKLCCKKCGKEEQNAAITKTDAKELLNIDVLKPIQCDLSDAEAFVTRKDNKLVVAFRGTESLKDMKADLVFTLDKWLEPIVSDSTTNKQDVLTSKCIHSGFKEQYVSVRVQVHAEIKEKLEADQNSEILITGHSLGGALATICALDLALSYPKIKSNIKLITVGAPAVGNEEFAKVFKDEVPFCVRLVKRWDLVPKLGLGVVHVGKQIALRESSNSLFSLLPLTAHSATGYVTGAEKSQKYAKRKRESYQSKVASSAKITTEVEPGIYKTEIKI